MCEEVQTWVSSHKGSNFCECEVDTCCGFPAGVSRLPREDSVELHAFLHPCSAVLTGVCCHASLWSAGLSCLPAKHCPCVTSPATKQDVDRHVCIEFTPVKLQTGWRAGCTRCCSVLSSHMGGPRGPDALSVLNVYPPPISRI